jgi:rRNA maturation RNase YbeY
VTVSVLIRREVPSGPPAAWIVPAARAALRAAGSRAGALTVVLTDSRRIRRLNARFAAVDRVTDVLAFPAQPARGARDRYLGDVVISLPRARRQARSRRVDVREELALLVVHGTLHLLGFDHDRPRSRRKMWRLQAAALRRLGLDPGRLEVSA